MSSSRTYRAAREAVVVGVMLLGWGALAVAVGGFDLAAVSGAALSTVVGSVGVVTTAVYALARGTTLLLDDGDDWQPVVAAELEE